MTRMKNFGHGAMLAGAMLMAAGSFDLAAEAQEKPKVGIIGSGSIGGNVGALLANAGYDVMLSARNLGPVRELVAKIGPNASAGTPEEAAAFGDVIIISVPFAAVGQVGRDYATELRGKIVVDTANPNEARDGKGWTDEVRARANEALEVGTGVVNQRLLPGTRYVKGFSITFGRSLQQGANKADRTGITLSSDDKEAMDVVAKMIWDMGYEAVIVGDVTTAKIYDTCHPADTSITCDGEKYHTTGQTAKELRTMLGLN